MGELRGRWHHLTSADQLEVLERLRAGASLDAAAQAMGCSRCTVQRLVYRTGGVKPRVVPRSALRLSLAEREEISRGVVAGESCRSIARRLARAPSTISRELIAGSTSQRYRAWRADVTEYIAFDEIDDGLWEVRCGPLLLASMSDCSGSRMRTGTSRALAGSPPPC
jgi:DNA-binding CsgD family transcriptional regulator